MMMPRTTRASGPFPRRAPFPRRRVWRALVALAFCCFIAGPAQAFKNGAAVTGCNGCHGGGKVATVSVTPDLMTVNPGDTLNLTISISQTNGPVAGFYIDAGGVGAFHVVDSGTKLAGTGVTQTAPRTGSNGFTTFKVGWTAPAKTGGVDFNVWANSANGDGTSKGDGEGVGFFSTAFGCAGIKYYRDYDSDGVGSESSGYTMNCAVPQYYSVKAGDCNDNDEKIFPGASEICDGKDNNCDGKIDENLAVGAYCVDEDGDGHGVSSKGSKMACGVSKGFGKCDNDCNDADATVYPGATETCNNRDDNCNNQVDEGARATCGVGWCAKLADSCNATAASCTPGQPRNEECNDFDDDCDGVKDNGTNVQLCKSASLACRGGYCVDASGGAPSTPMTSAGASSGGRSSGSSGSSNVGGEGGAQPSEPSGGAEPPPAPSQAGRASGTDDSQGGGCALNRSPAKKPRAPLSSLLLVAAAVVGVRRRRSRSRAPWAS